MIKNRTQLAVGAVSSLLFLSVVVFANWIISHVGMLPIGFGLQAASGTLFAGFAIAFRDIIQDTLGRFAILILIAAGTLLSFAMSAPEVALASAAAFGFGELMNFAVYTPLRTRSTLGDKRWALAVASSNVAASLIDSVLFIAIAFGPSMIASFALGQFVGKLYATLLYLLIGSAIAALRRRVTTPKEIAYA